MNKIITIINMYKGNNGNRSGNRSGNKSRTGDFFYRENLDRYGYNKKNNQKKFIEVEVGNNPEQKNVTNEINKQVASFSLNVKEQEKQEKEPEVTYVGFIGGKAGEGIGKKINIMLDNSSSSVYDLSNSEELKKVMELYAKQDDEGKEMIKKCLKKYCQKQCADYNYAVEGYNKNLRNVQQNNNNIDNNAQVGQKAKLQPIDILGIIDDDDIFESALYVNSEIHLGYIKMSEKGKELEEKQKQDLISKGKEYILNRANCKISDLKQSEIDVFDDFVDELYKMKEKGVSNVYDEFIKKMNSFIQNDDNKLTADDRLDEVKTKIHCFKSCEVAQMMMDFDEKYGALRSRQEFSEMEQKEYEKLKNNLKNARKNFSEISQDNSRTMLEIQEQHAKAFELYEKLKNFDKQTHLVRYYFTKIITLGLFPYESNELKRAKENIEKLSTAQNILAKVSVDSIIKGATVARQQMDATNVAAGASIESGKQYLYDTEEVKNAKPGFLKRLFSYELPDYQEGALKIKKIDPRKKNIYVNEVANRKNLNSNLSKFVDNIRNVGNTLENNIKAPRIKGFNSNSQNRILN